MEILAISLGRNILQEKSGEHVRMQTYASMLEALHVVVLTRKSHGFSSVIHEGNLHVYPTNSSSRLMMLVDAYKIGKKILKKVQGDSVVTAQDPFEIGMVSYLLTLHTRSRFHIQIHGDYFGASKWQQGSLIRKIRRIVARKLIKRACGVRVVSFRIKDSLVKEGFAPQKITILPIRPALEVFLDTEHKENNDGKFVFLMASRFAPEKNIGMAIRAFSTVAKEFKNIHLKLIGRGEEEKRIRSLVNALGISEYVTVLPWTEHLADDMSSAHVFLLSSDHEAYALTLVEALAAGLPVVTTDVGCVGDVVQDQIHGIVVPVGDEVGYTNALRRMVIDTTFRLACKKACREKARELVVYSNETYTKEWVACHSCKCEGV